MDEQEIQEKEHKNAQFKNSKNQDSIEKIRKAIMDRLEIQEKDRRNAQFFIEDNGNNEAQTISHAKLSALLNSGSTFFVDSLGTATSETPSPTNNGSAVTRYSAHGRNNTNYQRGVCGLQNLGNTCFMNSALQCLSNVPELTEYFLSESYATEINEQNPLGTQGRLVTAYAELLQEMWSGNSSSVRPWKLKCVIGKFAPRFNGYAQQDSQELTAFLLDGLHEDLNRIKRKPYIEEKEVERRDKVQAAEEAWNDYKKRNDSQIVDLLHGQLKSTLTCNVCQRVSTKFDPFCFLSVQIPAKEQVMAKTADETAEMLKNGPIKNGDISSRTLTPPPIKEEKNVENDGNGELQSTVIKPSSSQLSLVANISYGFFSWLLFFLNYINPLNSVGDWFKEWFSDAIPLEHCLRVFFSIDHLCGEDKYSCEHCKQLQNGTKHSIMTRLPQILIIHLKRFRYEGAYNAKMRTRITFPLFGLDMAPFMQQQQQSAAGDDDSATIKTAMENDNSMMDYDLCGLISHRGQNMEYGHYIAYCRNPEDQKWYEFDDSQVTRVSPIEVANQEAYVLFYERRGGDPTELSSVEEEWKTCDNDEEEEKKRNNIGVEEAEEKTETEMMTITDDEENMEEGIKIVRKDDGKGGDGKAVATIE